MLRNFNNLTRCRYRYQRSGNRKQNSIDYDSNSDYESEKVASVTILKLI